MLKLLALQELTPALLAAIDAGLPVLATCAGLILLADRV
jgi:glutamine amidotransferase PdxT